MDYNSTREKLVMPEYGRHIQNMIKYAITIPNRAERTRCAHTIVNIMAGMSSSQRESHDFWQKMWDHLHIMSDFKLDIDSPYNPPQPNRLHSRPERVPYQKNDIRLRRYGKNVEKFIAKAVDTTDPVVKRGIVQDIANFMKKTLISLNKDFATDERLFNDMRMLSNNRLEVDGSVRTSYYSDPDRYGHGQQNNFGGKRQVQNNKKKNNQRGGGPRNNKRNRR